MQSENEQIILTEKWRLERLATAWLAGMVEQSLNAIHRRRVRHSALIQELSYLQPTSELVSGIDARDVPSLRGWICKGLLDGTCAFGMALPHCSLTQGARLLKLRLLYVILGNYISVYPSL